MDAPASPAALEPTLLDSLIRIAPSISPHANAIDNLERLSGGATQEIWRFVVIGPNGRDSKILRRARQGAKVGETGIGLEMEAELVAAAAAAGVPVPRVDYVLRPADGLGRGYVMNCIDGETLGGRIVKSEKFAAARQTLASDCGTILAQIHAVDPARFAWLDRRSPVQLVDQWLAVYRAGSVVRPVFELAFRWLASHVPADPDRPALVHGDFRNGNLMIGPEGVRAVLDWELAHIGDPMEDLGWLCVNSWRFGCIDRPVGGFGRQEDLFDAYERQSGRRVNRTAIRWWEIFGTIRWGAICAGGLANFRLADPTIERAMIARRASETEIDLLRLLSD
ncbi:phosphotransferase family protein [Bradyrhizobium sp. INPA03-11B]|uniref:phosphotransferase family protein n=1 Tax=Bradyrhizobium sp. INPA03-11B TaxID=418598 RepID=UPI00338E23A5